MPSTNPLLIQVVAQLKPERCGVSDHGLALARELETAYGIRSAFAVVNSTEEFDLPYPRVYCPQAKLIEGCITLSQGQPAALLVHLSGYGFSRDGAPAALAAALARVREDGRFRVAVFFHELYAFGFPWRKSFWYSRRQKKAIRRIAQDCDLLVTNVHRHVKWLERQEGKRSELPIPVLPVFSNVGETGNLTPITDRKPVLVIFGISGTRRRAYKQLPSLKRTLSILGVEEILDVGPSFDVPSESCGIPVRRMGTMAAAELADLLSHSMFGFVQHTPDFLGKSGVFAGFSACGTVSVIAKPFAGEFDGLRDGFHLLSPGTAKAALDGGLESCSAAAWRWYSGHSLHVHAATYARWLVQPLTDGAGDLSIAGRVTEDWMGHAPR